MSKERVGRSGPSLQLEYSGCRLLREDVNAAIKEHIHNVSHSRVKMGVSLAGQCLHTRGASAYLAGPPVFPVLKRHYFLYTCFRRRYRRRYCRQAKLETGLGRYFQAAEKGGIAHSAVERGKLFQSCC